MRFKTLLKLALVLSPVFSSNAAHARVDLSAGDSITMCNQVVTCALDGGGTGGNCASQPGTRECGQWQEVSRTCEHYIESHVLNGCYASRPYFLYTKHIRTCRTFDGCGTPTGEFPEDFYTPSPDGRCYQTAACQ